MQSNREAQTNEKFAAQEFSTSVVSNIQENVAFFLALLTKRSVFIDLRNNKISESRANKIVL